MFHNVWVVMNNGNSKTMNDTLCCRVLCGMFLVALFVWESPLRGVTFSMRWIPIMLKKKKKIDAYHCWKYCGFERYSLFGNPIICIEFV